MNSSPAFLTEPLRRQLLKSEPDRPGVRAVDACLELESRLARQNAFWQGHRLRVPKHQAQGKKPLSASIMVQKYLRPAAVKAGVIEEGEKVRFGFHNFRHALQTALVKLRVDAKTVQGMLRHEDFGTTMQLYAQSDMESMRDAQGKFLEQLLGDRIHLLTEKVQGQTVGRTCESWVGSWVGNFDSVPLSALE